jgi:fimbrial chaperone protein
MRSWIIGLLSATAVITAPLAAYATSLQLSPVNVEVPAPGAASIITLTNTGSEDMNAQIRVFKWMQVNGQDQLVPTKDVVVSPPAMKIGPGKNSVVRIVRTGKTPVVSEETYRLKVDEIPKLPRAGQAAVGFAVSYSVPVFFSNYKQGAQLNWKASIVKGQIRLEADNAGDRHARLADLKIVNAAKVINVAPGLSGYVLRQSAKVWLVKGGAKFAVVGDTIKIIATGDTGPIETTAHVVAAN